MKKVYAVYNVHSRREDSQRHISATMDGLQYNDINDGVTGMLNFNYVAAAGMDFDKYYLVTVEELPDRGDKHPQDAYGPVIAQRKAEEDKVPFGKPRVFKNL